MCSHKVKRIFKCRHVETIFLPLFNLNSNNFFKLDLYFKLIFLNRSFIRLPAKYLDPMTQLPYKNIQTFRLLREAYYQQLEARSDVNDTSQNPELSRWLEWRQKNRRNSQRNTVRLEPASSLSIPPVSS